MPRTLLKRLQYPFWIVGALLCGFCTEAWIETRSYQAVESQRLEAELRSAKPRPSPDLPVRPPSREAGDLVGRLEIPRLRLSAMVLEGSDSRTLRLGVGRVPQTADPGQTGNMVLGGHRDTFFRPLRGIQRGDRIMLTTPAGQFRYEVEWTSVVQPTDTSSLQPTRDPSLTLVTCYPFQYVGPAPERFIVRARQITTTSRLN